MENSIPKFYAGKSVFITGGTGFLGKVLVEKILRSCPDVENIYLLVRSKKDKNIDNRQKELLNSAIFDRLRENDPQSLLKITLIEGDISSIGFGLSDKNRKLLCDKVSIVIHSAATVRYNEPLRVAVNTNLRSLYELIKLSREIKNLQSLVHISTAFSNWPEINIKEDFYGAQHDPHHIIGLCNNSTNEQLEKIQPKLLGKHTNTYSFTKSLAEVLFSVEAKDMPAAMIRPSIVACSMTEPYAGWNDAYTASTPDIDMISRGLSRSVYGHKNVVLDLIPVDIVINMVIAASWKTSIDRLAKPSISAPFVYNCVSGSINPISLKQVFDLYRDMGRNYPSESLAWYPKIRYFKSATLYKMDRFLTHFLPAYLLDLWDGINGKSGRNLKLQKSINKGQVANSFVLTTPLRFQGDKFKELSKSMNSNDQKDFNFDPRTINWKNYIKDYHFGTRKFIFNDTSIGSPLAMKKLQRFKMANRFLTASTVLISLFAIKKSGDIILNKSKN